MNDLGEGNDLGEENDLFRQPSGLPPSPKGKAGRAAHRRPYGGGEADAGNDAPMGGRENDLFRQPSGLPPSPKGEGWAGAEAEVPARG